MSVVSQLVLTAPTCRSKAQQDLLRLQLCLVVAWKDPRSIDIVPSLPSQRTVVRRQPPRDEGKTLHATLGRCLTR